MITNFYNLTIASGASLSNIISIRRTETVIGVEIPSDWTSAPLSFLASVSTTPKTVVKDGTEYTASGTGSFNSIDPITLLGAKSLQVRSGTSVTPVNQIGPKTIVVITGEFD